MKSIPRDNYIDFLLAELNIRTIERDAAREQMNKAYRETAAYQDEADRLRREVDEVADSLERLEKALIRDGCVCGERGMCGYCDWKAGNL